MAAAGFLAQFRGQGAVDEPRISETMVQEQFLRRPLRLVQSRTSSGCVTRSQMSYSRREAGSGMSLGDLHQQHDATSSPRT
ncbi:MAG: hypothetical protein MZV64_74210 [Ignavibacteriales bacterium]|nr:hypothetical protein [Ignavibacteriales bacterium]